MMLCGNNAMTTTIRFLSRNNDSRVTASQALKEPITPVSTVLLAFQLKDYRPMGLVMAVEADKVPIFRENLAFVD
ncbi:hypothetical protein K2173_003765 [Erythroxylum novogranatense]|uniref:Uncharacterized protein n=1 Tax=Erythroxylum novogranatense TaxID=1862640 RepID=A0AAV8SIW1_9ROSI|nr:hypothetical protein K2173_003765 [Erythroxylum novogranatense]